MNFSQLRGSVTTCGCITFSARSRPVESCSATYTAPIPPSASGRITRKSFANYIPGCN